MFDVPWNLAGRHQSLVACGVEHIGVQGGLGTIDVVDEALHAAGEGEVLFLAVALVDQRMRTPLLRKGQLAQALGKNRRSGSRCAG
jgi:hypothetical protein